MKRINNYCWGIACLALLLGGCGGSEGGEDLPATVEASGVVTLDGAPVEGGSIVCVPADGGQYPAFASTDSRGRFELKAFEAKSGAVPGLYQVQISRTVEVAGTAPTAAQLGEDAAHAAEGDDPAVGYKNDLPKLYASVATSGLSIEVPKEGLTDIKLEMTSTP